MLSQNSSSNSNSNANSNSNSSLVFTTNAKRGDGITAVVEQLAIIGREINMKRERKDGFGSRPVRAVVVGYPNVGKSALINRMSKSVKMKHSSLLFLFHSLLFLSFLFFFFVGESKECRYTWYHSTTSMGSY